MRSPLADHPRMSAWVAPALLLGLTALLPVACAPGPAPVVYAPAPVVAERAVVLSVNFDFDSYRLRPESRAVLDNTAQALLDPRFAYSRFEVNGHTDITGRFGYNVALSRLRADAVVEYLAARGVPRDKMRAQGFGPLQLFDASNPRSGVNRRVEVVALQ